MLDRHDGVGLIPDQEYRTRGNRAHNINGTATSEQALAMAPLVRPLADKAWEFARAAGAR